jgi:RNA polymerase sigma-70 factor (ECF subfamily)
MDEDALIKAAQEGDLEAFNRLVLTYQDLAFSVAYRVLGDDDAAADITQEAFIKAYRYIGTFQAGSFRAWLARIVTNACYDELRRKKRRPSVPLAPSDPDAHDDDQSVWMVDQSDSPEDRVVRSELVEAIQHCLEQLPDEFRLVAVMVDVQGFTYAEAATAISRPVGTVRSRLARARERLQECLQGFRELLPGAFRFEGEAS